MTPVDAFLITLASGALLLFGGPLVLFAIDCFTSSRRNRA